MAKKVLIAVPSMEQVSARFAAALASLQKYETAIVNFEVGSLIYDARNQLAARALQLGCDYIMWFDSDMTFEPDTMTRLIQDLEEGRDIVSGLYFRRKGTYAPVIFSRVGIKEGFPDWEGLDDYPRDDIFEVEGIGFGCVCMRTEILYKIMDDNGDWFQPVGHYGEDLSFCMRARKSGFKIYVDSRVKCGHVGLIEINEAFYDMIRPKK